MTKTEKESIYDRLDTIKTFLEGCLILGEEEFLQATGITKAKAISNQIETIDEYLQNYM